MCGRFALTKDKKEITVRFRLNQNLDFNFIPSFNIAPSQNIYVILNESIDKLSLVRWGLVPSWAKDEKSGFKMINSRMENIPEKPFYQKCLKSQRCLILADSFFEWDKKADKAPYRIYLENEDAFAFAGIWNNWNGIETCSIITTPANSLISAIHDRMPVILPKDSEEKWLCESNTHELFKMLKPFDSVKMRIYEISSLVNSWKNNSINILIPKKVTRNALHL